MLHVINEISQYNIQKITFAGGEPILCKWLDELIIYAKAKLFDNVQGKHGYSDPIQNFGMAKVHERIEIRRDKFEAQGGIYEWRASNNPQPL